LKIPTNNGVPEGIFDGQTFSIQSGARSVVFELDGNGTVGLNNVAVPLNTASADQQAALIVAAINASGLGLNATFSAGGMIAVGTQSDLRIVTSGGLQVVGVPGREVTTPIVVDLSEVKAASQVATIIADVLEQANMAGVEITVLGDQIFIEGSLGVGGLGTQVVSGIRDKAGNPMRATELNGDTLVTIFLGEGFDYGDAPDPNYSSLRESNGPRHKVVEGFSLGLTNTADPDAKVPDQDQDDGLIFKCNRFRIQRIVPVQRPRSLDRTAGLRRCLDRLQWKRCLRFERKDQYPRSDRQRTEHCGELRCSFRIHHRPARCSTVPIEQRSSGRRLAFG